MNGLNPTKVQYNPLNVGGNNAALLGLMTKTLDDVGTGIQDYSRQGRDEAISKLMGSGALKGLSEADARAKLLGVSKGDVGAQTQESIKSLLGGKKSAVDAQAKVDAARLLNLNKVNLQKNMLAGAMDRTKEQTAQSNANAFMSREQTAKQNDLNRKHALKLAQLGLTAKGANKIDPDALRKVAESQGGFDEMLNKSFESIEDDNTFFDVDYNADSRNRIKGAVKSSILNNEYLNQQFRLDPASFTRMVVETLGKTDTGWSPVKFPGTTLGEDDWVPDLTSDKIKDLELKLRSMKGK